MTTTPTTPAVERVARAARQAAARAELATLCDEQHGVVSTSQVLGCGLGDADLRRLVRRRELTLVHPRVYVDHTGPLTWIQRAWAAVLWAGPAALCGESAVRVGEGPGRAGVVDDGPIHVAIEHDRRLAPQPGVVVHRMRHYAAWVQDGCAPARIHYDEAILDLAGAARTDNDAIARLADACGARRTTGSRLLARALTRTRLARSELIVRVLGDIATGSCSALEQQCLTRVLRAHGLPEGVRQASHRQPGNNLFRDVLIAELALVLELDGRAHHSSARARDADMDRDLDAAAVDDLLTIRLSWGQSVDRACATAARLAVIMRRRGWTGPLLACPDCRAAA